MTSLLGKYIKLKNKLQNSGMEQFLRKLVFCPTIRYCGSKTRILLDGFPLEGYQSIIPSCTPPEEEGYYLRRAFDSSNSIYGTPFLDGDCYYHIREMVLADNRH